MIDIRKMQRVVDAINSVLSTGQDAKIEIHKGEIVVLAEKRMQKVVLKYRTDTNQN